MGVGAAALLSVSAISGEDWAPSRELPTILAFTYLTASSIVLFLLVLLVVRRWTASASAYVFLLAPPVSLVLGATLADDIPVHVTRMRRTSTGNRTLRAGTRR